MIYTLANHLPSVPGLSTGVNSGTPPLLFTRFPFGFFWPGRRIFVSLFLLCAISCLLALVVFTAGISPALGRRLFLYGPICRRCQNRIVFFLLFLFFPSLVLLLPISFNVLRTGNRALKTTASRTLFFVDDDVNDVNDEV